MGGVREGSREKMDLEVRLEKGGTLSWGGMCLGNVLSIAKINLAFLI